MHLKKNYTNVSVQKVSVCCHMYTDSYVQLPELLSVSMMHNIPL